MEVSSLDSSGRPDSAACPVQPIQEETPQACRYASTTTPGQEETPQACRYGTSATGQQYSPEMIHHQQLLQQGAGGGGYGSPGVVQEEEGEEEEGGGEGFDPQGEARAGEGRERSVNNTLIENYIYLTVWRGWGGGLFKGLG